MSYPPTVEPTKDKHASCYDYQHKPNYHRHDRQRYVSPTTGKCRWLRVQCTPAARALSTTVGTTHALEQDVGGGAIRALKLAYWLTEHSPFSEYLLGWIGRWLWLVLCLFWPINSVQYQETYKPYLSRFWGQLWAARSEREYAIRMAELHGQRMALPEGHQGDVHTITHAAHPRQLIIYDGKYWQPCTDVKVLARTYYLAISYRQADFLTPNIEAAWGSREAQLEVQKLKSYVSDLARSACQEQGFRAYWLDFECTGDSQAEKNADLYRLADVFRGASKTVILIRDRHLNPLNSIDVPPRSQQKRDAEEEFGWKSWGGRVWTFPEALLSSELVYKFGTEAVRPITLRQIGCIAYAPDQEEMRIINGFSGKDPLERIERQTLLKNAIWRRSSGPASTPSSQHINTGTGSQFTAYPAERVYALMGFFEHRIMPDPRESILHALARLSMANDSDRLAERMIAMLPSSIPDQACWYADDDVFGARLCDVEPVVQVAGITSSGALVLDGCRAVAIRWKNFPQVAFGLKPSFRRSISSWLPYIFAPKIIIGIALLPLSGALGAVIIVMSLLILIFAPKLLVYGNTGTIVIARPWLVGIKGFMTAEQVGVELYGCVSQKRDAPTISYSSSGSILARPSQSHIRGGDQVQSEYVASQTPNIYTLVDTISNTVYYFTAARPPTVCLYVGREGGLGRFVLCSESCGLNELHKETVLRMPSYIANQMRFTDWVAVGGLDSTEGMRCLSP